MIETTILGVLHLLGVNLVPGLAQIVGGMSILAPAFGRHEGIDALLLGFPIEPFSWTVFSGIAWTFVQAALDRPWWTKRRRVALVSIMSVVISLCIWVAGVYPFAWEMIVTMATMVAGISWMTYNILKFLKVGDLNLLEWVGILTPGGETYEGRHRGTKKAG